MSAAPLEERIRAAAARRAPLRRGGQTTALRLLNGEGDGVPGVTVDAFGDVLCASLYEPLTPAREQALFDAIGAAVPSRALFVKRRPKEARVEAGTRKDALAPANAERGETVESLTAKEDGLSFLIRPGQGLSVGLYLDMREVRGWLREHARGKTVLNTFAYTCGFSVAARAGGAARVLNLDLSRRVLDWGAQNAALNGQPVDPRDYVSGDVFDWLRRLGKKGERFDFVVLDPPSFSTAKGVAFSAARDYAGLVALAAPLVAQGGVLLACCNLATLAVAAFEALVDRGVAQAGRASRGAVRLRASAVDFPDPPGRPPPLKVVALTIT